MRRTRTQKVVPGYLVPGPGASINTRTSGVVPALLHAALQATQGVCAVHEGREGAGGEKNDRLYAPIYVRKQIKQESRTSSKKAWTAVSGCLGMPWKFELF